MNRFVIRALVAVLAFSFGVLVSSVLHPRYHRYHGYQCRRLARLDLTEFRPQMTAPALSIDNPSTDPLKVSLSGAGSKSSFARPSLNFLVENNSGRAISGFTVTYRSGLAYDDKGDGGSVTVNYQEGPGSFSSNGAERVSINCDANEMLTVWVSSVDYKDGSHWTNPRH